MCPHLLPLYKGTNIVVAFKCEALKWALYSEGRHMAVKPPNLTLPPLCWSPSGQYMPATIISYWSHGRRGHDDPHRDCQYTQSYPILRTDTLNKLSTLITVSSWSPPALLAIKPCADHEGYERGKQNWGACKNWNLGVTDGSDRLRAKIIVSQ